MTDGPHCVKHPDRTGRYLCSKYAEYLCDECMACRDQKAYCTFRGACLINEIEKQKSREQRRLTSHAGRKILD